MDEASCAKTVATEAAVSCEKDLTKGDTPEETVSKPVETASVEKVEETTKEAQIPANNISFVVVHNKNKLKVTWDANSTVETLKTHLHDTTGVQPAMQKLMFKGLLRDDQTLSKAGIGSGSKLMLVGSKLTDVISANAKAEPSSSSTSEPEKVTKEPLSKQKPHTKIVNDGIPDDAMPAYINGNDSLPDIPLYGMVNKYGHKVRLTFKLESDQVWIGTKERTDKVNMTSIKQVVSEPISGHEQYHMLALQKGPTEQSRYWIYWVPAQYVKAIKDMILGQWQLF